MDSIARTQDVDTLEVEGGTYFCLPSAVLENGLDYAQIAVLTHLYCLARWRHEVPPTAASIGQALQISVTRVRRAMAELERQGWLTQEPGLVILSIPEGPVR